MPRNRYTRLVRKQQQAQIARQEKELAALAKKLKIQDDETHEVPLVNKEKVRRSARIEQDRRHRSKRRGNADENQK